MDAKITKQRLGNLLSYDWLKILGVIAAAIAVLVMIFTMVATRPKDEQVFTVYGYLVAEGSAGSSGVGRSEFSYEILKTGSETFTESTANIFSVRRSVYEGTVLFVSGAVKNEGTEEETSDLLAVTGGRVGAVALDTQKYFNDCKNYLIKFFGEGLEEEAFNAELSKETFLARNGKDKRFRSEAKREAGILLEEERLKKLRADYLTVEEAFANGKLQHNVIETEDGQESISLRVGALNKINRIYYCGNFEDAQDTLNLVLLNNRNEGSDLRYETVSYLSYLVKNYD